MPALSPLPPPLRTVPLGQRTCVSHNDLSYAWRSREWADRQRQRAGVEDGADGGTFPYGDCARACQGEPRPARPGANEWNSLGAWEWATPMSRPR